MEYKNAKINEFKIEEDCVSITVDYEDWGSQGVSFDLEKKDLLKELFPLKEKVKVFFEGHYIDGLINSKGTGFFKDPEWKKAYELKQKKKAEIAAKKYKEEMMAIPIYRYESKYQFPDDINIASSDPNDGNGFRNSAHLSVSRGMEFLEDKNLDDFSMKEYKNIGGITEDNKSVEQLKDHIEKCVTTELGSRWGHSGASISYAAGHAMEAKKLGWDNYIQWIRSWKDNKKEDKGEE